MFPWVSDTHAQRMRVLQEDTISFTSIDALFIRWYQIKGQCTDVKCGCGSTVGSSLNPHSRS